MDYLKSTCILNGHWPLLGKLKITKNIAHLGLRNVIFSLLRDAFRGNRLWKFVLFHPARGLILIQGRGNFALRAVSLRSLSTVFNCVKELHCGHWFRRKWRCLSVTQVSLSPSELHQCQKSGTGSGVTQPASSIKGSGRAPLPHRTSL